MRARRAVKAVGAVGLSLLLVRGPLTAQIPRTAASASPAASPPPGSELTISLMTMGPGAQVWERFGHNAIWVQDRSRGTSIAYNYGLFSFRQENFILRFIQGRMSYWMAGFDALPYAQLYFKDHRSAWVQELNLSPAARLELRDFLEWNAREENRFYPYDYYRDNCSTRVRDALDRALQGEIRRQTDTVRTATTYRSETRRLSLADVPIYTGLMVLLGPRADRPLSEWEQMFLPLKFQEHLRHVTLPDGKGVRIPLVASERTLYLSDIYPEPGPKPAPVGRFLAVAGLLGALLAAGGRWGARSRVAARVFLGVAALVSLVAGTAGVILAGIWAFTDHQIAYGNQNVVQVNLLGLPLSILLVLALFGSAQGPRWGRRIAATILILSGFGSLFTALHLGSQDNLEIVALAFPINLGLALGLRWFGSAEPSTLPR